MTTLIQLLFVKQVSRAMALYNVKLICSSHLKVGEMGCAFRVWMGKPEEKRQLGRQSRRSDDTIKMDLQVRGCGTWAGLTWFEI